MRMMSEKRIEVLCVNETKRKGCETTTHGPYTTYLCGVPETSRGCQGVGVLLADRMNESVTGYNCEPKTPLGEVEGRFEPSLYYRSICSTRCAVEQFSYSLKRSRSFGIA